MAVFRLEKEHLWFPSAELGEENGLLAVGGDLSVPRLLLAYQNGIFPWYNPGEEILWWCPLKRFIIIPSEIHIARSMKKHISHFSSKSDCQLSFNQNFGEVMHQCRILREEGSWISDELERAYHELHRLGYAMSVEVYENDALIGGLYGVAIGRCFFGESMFSKRPNASKQALIKLADELMMRGFYFIDCQFQTEHLERMGGKYINYQQYMAMVVAGIGKFGTPGRFELSSSSPC